MFAWFFISALYLQLVLGYTPMQVGLAFLPANLIMAAFSLGPVGEARDALRHSRAARGRPAARGGRARAVRARAASTASFVVDVLPGDGAARHRRGHRVQSGAARGDERRRRRRNRASPRAW